MRIKRLSWLTLTAFLFSIILPMMFVTPPAAAATGAIDTVADEMALLFPYLDLNDKSALDYAKSNLNDFTETDTRWEAIVDPLLTGPVNDKLTAAGKTPKTELIGFLANLNGIYYTYSADKAEIIDSLDNFKDQHRDLFKTLFGDSVAIDDLANFLKDTRQALPAVLKTEPEQAHKLIFGSNQELINGIPDLFLAAMEKALPNYPGVEEKLTELNWPLEALVDQHLALAKVVDPSGLADLAFAKANVRSQAKAYTVEASALNEVGPTGVLLPAANNIANTTYHKLKIMDTETTSLVQWQSSNPGVVTVVTDYDNGRTLKLVAKSIGEATITAYRDYPGATAKNDWILRFTAKVSPAAKEITSFSFSDPAVNGIINQGSLSITLMVPPATDVTNLVATFTHSPNTAVTVAGTPQVSGVTTNDFTHPVTYTVTALDDNTQVDYRVSVIGAIDATTGTGLTLDSETEGSVKLSNGASGILLGNNTVADLSQGLSVAEDNQITVGGVAKDLNSFTSGNLHQTDLTLPQTVGDQEIIVNQAVQLNSGVTGQPVTLINNDLTNANLTIPDASAILAPSNWDGTIQPAKKGQIDADESAPSGFKIGGTVIEVGAPGSVLLFDKPVIIVLEGVTGKVGYRPAGSKQWKEIQQLAGGTYEDPIPPAFPGEAYISNGFDTKIITWHLTAFATLETYSTGGGGGGGGGGTASKFVGTTVTKNGGTVTDKGVSVTIPAKALSENIKVKIEKVSDIEGLPVPANSQLISDVYEITKDMAGNFEDLVTITLPFDKTKVDLDRYHLSLYWLKDVREWVELDNVKVDLTNAKVSGQIKHFAKFAVLATEKEALPDIVGHWAETNIKALVASNVITGYPDGTFKPNNTITRAEFTTAVVRAFYLEIKNGKIFNDTANHWAKEYIATAVANGYVSGYDSTTFGPDDLITREQMAVLIVNATKLQAANSAKTFADGSAISDWAKEGVAIASGNNLITGYPDNTFKPKFKATRAEAATILVKAMVLIQ